ncbi:MAG: InlB B-repeat-containing protein [Fibromonadaceae bacterium]|jgi:uncharacterized repeat protein (TIGR02543 family)|nr:InlB B-repeat-containing protein [Fibromonadaceae bacterium]
MSGIKIGKTLAAISIAILSLAATMPVNAQTPSTAWYTADPSAAVFTVSTANDLAGLAQIVNGTANSITTNNFSGKTVVLANDVDLSSYGLGSEFNQGNGWVPIGVGGGGPFAGTFDGNFKKVSGLYINAYGRYSYTGLFGWVYGGTVKNLGVIDVNINSGNEVGGAVGHLHGGSVANVYTTGAVCGGFSDEGAQYCCWAASQECHPIGPEQVWYGGIVTPAMCLDSNGVVQNHNIPPPPPSDYCLWDGGCWDINPDAPHIDGDGQPVLGETQRTACLKWSVGKAIYSDNACRVVKETAGGGGDEGQYPANTENSGNSIGGVVGYMLGGSVTGSYSTADVQGGTRAGGIVGHAGLGSPTAQITGCAALNPGVTGNSNIGRVIGSHDNGVVLSNNAAFEDMTGEFTDAIGESTLNGVAMSGAEIRGDGTIGERFTAEGGWVVENGKLPGFEAATELPEHLAQKYSVTFNADGGTPTPNAQEIDEGNKATKPTDPTKEGYNFAGWYIGETEFDFNTEITEAITLTAKWTETVPILNSQLSTLNSTTPLYYTLKGEPLGTQKPTVPGVYIEKHSGIIKRIVVR